MNANEVMSMQGILRVGAAVPHLTLANVNRNVEAHLAMLRTAAGQHVSLMVFPELSLTGASAGDLFRQQQLLDAVRQGIRTIAADMPEGITAVIGAPIEWRGRLFDCAVVLSRGKLHGAVPKGYLSESQKRHFHSGFELDADTAYPLDGGCELARDVIFHSADGGSFAVTFAEELLSPCAPCARQALAGAEVVTCLSALHAQVGRRERIRDKVRLFSADCLCACVYAEPGQGESTADTVCGGYAAAAVCGDMLREQSACLADDHLLLADVDTLRIAADRQRSSVFVDCVYQTHADVRREVALDTPLFLPADVQPDIHVPKLPFIPEDRQVRVRRCAEIFDMQAHGLARRMQITGGRIVIGISGGLDSTLALLVACKAADLLALPRTNILGVTMPCFGTTDWTYQSALELMRTLGIQQREIRIHDSVRQHFRDIGHDEAIRNAAYENAQARERTQVLMDLANDFGGIVLGTGDLSELALGWCTYNGDHMSMYGVNGSVPKTLVRWVTKTVSEMPEFAASRAVLERILDTPISPELLPPDEKGNIAQQTEDLVGPYALHDFFLYYAVRYGYRPQRVYEMCCMAFREDFDRETILKWLRNFYRRFFNQQFKRNCMPDGVKIGSISLSPRGDWCMPSDAQAALWLEECEKL